MPDYIPRGGLQIGGGPLHSGMLVGCLHDMTLFPVRVSPALHLNLHILSRAFSFVQVIVANSGFDSLLQDIIDRFCNDFSTFSSVSARKNKITFIKYLSQLH